MFQAPKIFGRVACSACLVSSMCAIVFIYCPLASLAIFCPLAFQFGGWFCLIVIGVGCTGACIVGCVGVCIALRKNSPRVVLGQALARGLIWWVKGDELTRCFHYEFYTKFHVMTFVKSIRCRSRIGIDHIIYELLDEQGLDAEQTIFEVEDTLKYSIRHHDLIEEDYDYLNAVKHSREYSKFSRSLVNSMSHNPEL